MWNTKKYRLLFIWHWLNTVYYIYRKRYCILYVLIRYMPITCCCSSVYRLGTLDTAGGKDTCIALLVRTVHLMLGATADRRNGKI